MAGKKISELTEVTSITDADELVFVDKEGTGSESGAGGKTARITFANLKTSLGTSGQKGEPGMDGSKGEPGSQGEPGEGADSYWTTGSVADTIGYAGKVGIGTTEPNLSTNGLHVQGPAHAMIQVEGLTGNSMIGLGNPTDLTGSYAIKHDTLGDVNFVRIATVNAMNQGGGMTLTNNDLTVAGKIGIGTDSPTHKLHIEGGVRIQPSATKPGFVFGSFNNDTPDGTYLQFNSTGEDNLSGQTASKITLQSLERFGTNQGGYRDLTLNSLGGNVGIGTDNPSEKLEVDGNVKINNSLGGGSYELQFLTEGTNPTLLMNHGTAGTKVQISTDSSTFFNGGNIGIGTTAPKEKLHVFSSTDNSVVAKFTRPFAEGATNEETYNYESFVSVQAGYKDDVWGEQSTVRFGARREANGNSASFVIQTKDDSGNLPAGERMVDRLAISSNGALSFTGNQFNWYADPETTNPGWTGAVEFVNRGKGTIGAEDFVPGAGFQFWTDSSATAPEITFTGEGHVGIGTTAPGAKLDVKGEANIQGEITHGECYAKRALQMHNLSHGLDIHIVNLWDLTSHSQYRSALVKITYTGRRTVDSSDSLDTNFVKMVELKGVTNGQYTAVGQSLIYGNDVNVSVKSNSSNGLVLHVPIPNGQTGTFLIEVLGELETSRGTNITYTKPSAQMPDEGYTSIPQEESSANEASSQSADLLGMIEALKSEVESLKTQLKGIE